MSVAQNLFAIDTLLIVILGCVVGIILGAIPGMNGGIGVAVLLPFTYTMQPAAALLFLGAIYMTSSYGGSIAGILINIPGTAESAPTAIEGYQMTKKGKGRQALYFAGVASAIGGIIGVLALIFFTPVLASLSVKFGPSEMFLVALCGLTIIGSLSGKSVSKGIFAVLFGVFLGMIGINQMTGETRFTFGIDSLSAGVHLIPAVIGFFAIAEMIKQITSKNDDGNRRANFRLEKYRLSGVLKMLKEKYKVLTMKSSILGTLIGLLPGTGGAIASFLAYGESKRSSKKRDEFGKGNPEGIVAAETANNAAVGGSIVPLLALGIPGSSTSAIMFGALLIHGLVPGPRLFSDHGDITYTFLIGMLLTVVFMFILIIIVILLFSLFFKIKVKFIIPAIIILFLI